ncbi:hypothetical protein GMOD_00000740 [Pyrenophora seminiperda CCB06]|uniref:Uncharacterized protein n=1 Tax=Pyrenophora seminiperda CCB06 TaxID=1302712 RepID=A0A3M7M821_9PLEO|nr:hypothetical protein GMOD_00000740 [Pyrenophora seminiperda CCB06]
MAPSESTHNNATSAADVNQDDSSIARSADVPVPVPVNLAAPAPKASNSTAAPPQQAVPVQNPPTTQETPLPAPKESYASYIANLPPPFWATKKPPPPPSPSAAQDPAIAAARINAVCAPVTAEQRAQDERLKAMSWRERWRYRKEARRAAAKEKDKEPDLRPVERGSRAQINVFGGKY